MQRYFVSQQSLQHGEATLANDDAHHISRVMRMVEGDKIIVADGSGIAYVCSLQSVNQDECKAAVVEKAAGHPEMPVNVTVAHGLPKGDKFEQVVKHGTELGAAAFLPFEADRSIARLDEKKAAKKQERWKKIVKEAAEQSHRNCLPYIHDLVTAAKLSEQFHQYDQVIVAYEESSKAGEMNRFAEVISKSKAGERILLVIGPEGGLSPQEAQMFSEAGGVLASFGPRILRTETAPLYGLAALSYYFELSR
ncbi:16S rRNA (uracil(1498)-N(3))-methyltransferase [Salisediminibacterium halotolerans]|uniref:16S rRNA (uracil(1498)-N(3))-methyltransferase n=1 Tax=Salisediminibacterium halotolerans TaxID=517425 RepID=UPI000EB459BC|nr:16S rRNA (uracil(1498)-N(3))-methyltransferase [Salisediminibacterium halotolerans]RLJ78164.1 16S rRNA (uracil1498-N3)-methyltransferase [Actinophytocola xinjiangensis]RPE88497.1 16S rRNA (uracil1498-N3)-methyltransferase [Salisediminibacterium halotolerans]TWG37141.1 16S rRNA (uracil1498-N3)-methyltransferase [Salisediminibacterium halotolerans]GEL07279.1 ribosomal RNA small subunit methyltransferase E [Salisediminibacterium halotolerans]